MHTLSILAASPPFLAAAGAVSLAVLALAGRAHRRHRAERRREVPAWTPRKRLGQ